MPGKYLMVTLLFIIFFSQNVLSVYSSGEFDKVAVVEWVWDGDTFRTTDDEWIRFADIDAPEEDENITAYWDSKNYLISTIHNKNVYLDIDDKYAYDQQGQGDRLVCVVYVEYNQTHCQNVNKALVENDLAVIWEHDNQFNPFTWDEYIPKNDIPEFTSLFVLPLFLTATSLALLIKRKMDKTRS